MRSFVILILFVFPLVANGQKWNISGEIFYGTFNMKSMKGLQDEMTRWYPNYSRKIVDNFPGYLGYSAMVGYSVSPRVDLGIRFQYTSTGGRVDYGDYSGQIRVDNLLRSNSLGIFTTVRLTSSSTWPVYFSFATGAARTHFRMINSFRLLDSFSEARLFESSTNYFFSPAISLNRRVSHQIRMYVSTGYEFQMHKALWGEGVRAEWDGVRVALGTTYMFSLKRKSL